MIHIEVERYGEPPCGGEVREAPLRGAPGPGEGLRRLPLYGAAPLRGWLCQRCGRRWEREPLPGEVAD